MRTLNASYCTQEWRFPTALPGIVTAHDGRTLGREPFGRYGAPFTLGSISHRFTLTTARRWDVLVDAVTPGTHHVEVSYLHWITGFRLLNRRVRIPIIVTE